MSLKNPTVAVHLTAKELAMIHRGLAWPMQIGSLGDKLKAADKDMRIANREKNRLIKQKRLARKREEFCPSSTSPSE
jgi:hypothetical protein